MLVLKRTFDLNVLLRHHTELQSYSEKVFPKATVLLGLSGFGQVDEVRVIVPGQSYVMEFLNFLSFSVISQEVS